MKRVLLASLPLVLSSCVVQKPSSVNGSDAIVEVTWTLRDVAGTAETCPAGTTVAEVIAQPVDPTLGTPEGSPTITSFDCDAMTGTISLVPDYYIISVKLQSADGVSVYANSLNTPMLTLTIEDTSEHFDIYTDGGYLQLSWELVNKLDQDVDCETAAVTDIRAVLTPTSGSGSAVTTTMMSCTDETDVTSPIPAGMYSVAINAEDNGTIVGTYTIPSEPIMAPNDVSGIGTITIPLTTM